MTIKLGIFVDGNNIKYVYAWSIYDSNEKIQKYMTFKVTSWITSSPLQDWKLNSNRALPRYLKFFDGFATKILFNLGSIRILPTNFGILYIKLFKNLIFQSKWLTVFRNHDIETG